MTHTLKRISLFALAVTLSAQIAAGPMSLSKMPLKLLKERKQTLIARKKEKTQEFLNQTYVNCGPFAISVKAFATAAGITTGVALGALSILIDSVTGYENRTYPFSVMGLPLAGLGGLISYDALTQLPEDILKLDDEVAAINRELHTRHHFYHDKMHALLDEKYIAKNQAA